MNTDRPSFYQIRIDNPHFEGRPEIIERYDASTRDPWAAARGYTRTVVLQDPATGWQAEYGWHEPTERWHLWEN